MSSINVDVLFWMLHLIRLFLYPSHYLLDHLLSLYIPTAEEKENGGIPATQKLILSPLYLLLLILTLPIFIVFFPIRCLLLFTRDDPYVFSVKFTPYTRPKNDNVNNVETRKNRFGLATINLCLLPEFMSRFNHLKDVGQRSKKIGERIVVDQFYGEDLKYNTKCNCTNSSLENCGGKINSKVCNGINFRYDSSNNGITGDISTRFCNIDFILIQEAWTTYYNRPLIQELHKVFPYIIHDAGIHSYSNNKFTLNSGLMVASRYPVTAVDFKPFDNFCKHGGLISQGLLMVQVNLGNEKNEGRRVGYLLNTHLQSYQDDEIVIPHQLDEILQFSKDFMNNARCPNDKVLFSILCGDFNCDNMSPGDKESQEHKLFDLFEDVGRVRPGVDKDWTIGTEMRQRFMHEPMMSTPKDMKEALLDPRHRRHHVNDADIQKHSVAALVNQDPPCDVHGNVLESPLGGKRRIDLVTIHKSHPVKVESYNFVTRLATLTDHIPVQIEFIC